MTYNVFGGTLNPTQSQISRNIDIRAVEWLCSERQARNSCCLTAADVDDDHDGHSQRPPVSKTIDDLSAQYTPPSHASVPATVYRLSINHTAVQCTTTWHTDITQLNLLSGFGSQQKLTKFERFRRLVSGLLTLFKTHHSFYAPKRLDESDKAFTISLGYL